jgi:tetratricopeptide (TPR) repeat protein
MKTESLAMIICLIAIFFFSQDKVYAQGFQTKEVSERITIISNPDIGCQVVVESEKGLLVFDSFWSEKTARLFKEEISKTLGREDFAYIINMVDRLDRLVGNKAYQEAVIVGHNNILTKYGDKKVVESEITELINMWRNKEELSRNRLEKYEKGTEQAKKEQEWLNTCKRTADELESDFSLVLPQILYNDRLTLYLGDITMKLLWFGKTGNYSGQTVAVIPEEKLAILSKSIVYPRHHLAPGLQPDYSELDVPRWIEALEEILEGENAVDNIILCDDDQVYSREQMQSHLKYIRKLWNRVTDLENEGKNLQEIKDVLSLEKEFSFVKEMMAYKENGDKWVRPQHELHTRLFFLQHKEHLASEIIKEGGIESLQASLDKIKNLGNAVYTDETSIWHLGYVWLNEGHVSESIKIFKLWVEAYSESFNAYDSLGEAYMKNGDVKNAIKNYKKSLELNPENNNAREKLNELK